MATMLVLDLFSGTGSATAAFKSRLHKVVHVERDRQHQAELYADVMTLTAADVLAFGWPYFIWASPPCTAFSVASIGTHWGGGHRAYEPKTDTARHGLALVAHTVALITEIAPPFWLMENPRGVLRKLPAVAGLQRWTVTYCQYGDERMKPTDLWGVMPDTWHPRPMCHNGAPCHDAAPRGAKTGTQGRSGATARGMVPFDLSLEICQAIESTRPLEAANLRYCRELP